MEQLKTLLRKYEGSDIDIANAVINNGDDVRSRKGKDNGIIIKEKEEGGGGEGGSVASHRSYALWPRLENQPNSSAGTVTRTGTRDTSSSSSALNHSQRTLMSSEKKQDQVEELCSTDASLRVCADSRALEEIQSLQREIQALRARHTYDQKEERRLQLFEKQETSKVRDFGHPQMRLRRLQFDGLHSHALSSHLISSRLISSRLLPFPIFHHRHNHHQHHNCAPPTPLPSFFLSDPRELDVSVRVSLCQRSIHVAACGEP